MSSGWPHQNVPIYFSTKSLMTASNEIAPNVSDSIDKIAKSFNLFSVDIADFKYFFILLRYEKDLSEDALVIAMVLKILKAISMVHSEICLPDFVHVSTYTFPSK